MLIKIVREGLGRIIVAIDYITRPRPMKRNKDDQAQVESELQTLSLYQFYACPFCVKTRRAIHKLNLPMTYRNAQKGESREELEAQGGRVKVPCLRIEEDNQVKWLYESSEIINYLNHRFA